MNDVSSKDYIAGFEEGRTVGAQDERTCWERFKAKRRELPMQTLEPGTSIPLRASVPPTVKFKKLGHFFGYGDIPSYATAGAAGLDLPAAATLTVYPGKWCFMPTGLAIELPAGYEGQVRPRSGLAAKHGVTVLNAPGTIDEDYRGEIKVILINFSDHPVILQSGERIAQLVIAPVTQVAVLEVDELSNTARGAGGFGSTGKA